MKEINVLSTFNGMGCIWYALDRNNIKVNKRYSCEIDKYANQANDNAYSDTIQLGDIRSIKAKDLEKIDLFVGGSPCQGFSFAGKQLAFDDPRSKLFFEFVRLWDEIKKINPDARFLLENVNMKKNELRIISEYMGVFPVNINSNLVSAQNRNRWYWTNIKTKDVGLFEELYTDIPQPEDKGILLKDILESEVDEKYYLKNTEILRGIEKAKGKEWKSGNRMGNMDFPNNETGKSKTLTTININGDRSLNHVGILHEKKGKKHKLTITDKSNCVDANYHKGIDNHQQRTGVCVAMRGRNPENPSDRKTGSPTEQRLEPKIDGKTNCLTNVAKDNLIFENNHLNKNYKNTNEKANAILQTSHKGAWANGMTIFKDNYRIRILTPRECGKLQTFTDAELDILLNVGISDTQLYKMFGNGWTIDVIGHILSFFNNNPN